MSKRVPLIASGLVTGIAMIVSVSALAQDRDPRRDDRYERGSRDEQDRRYESDRRYEQDRRYQKETRYERGRRYERDSYEQGNYVGVSAGWLNYEEDGLETLSPTILMLRVGQQFNPNFAIEGRLGTSIRSDETDDGFRMNAQAVYAGYVKGIYPISPTFSAYGLAGVAGVQIHRNYAESDTNDAGLSLGLGVEFNLGGGATLNAEWVRLTTGTNDEIYDYTADQLTFGVNWRW